MPMSSPVAYPAVKLGGTVHNLCSSVNRASTVLDMNSPLPNGVPRIITPLRLHTSWPRSSRSGKGGQAFQTRVLPVCKWMPALLGNVFSGRWKIARARPGDDKIRGTRKRNSTGVQQLLHLFQRIVQTETEQHWHEGVALFAGRWSEEARAFVGQLAKAKARSVPRRGGLDRHGISVGRPCWLVRVRVHSHCRCWTADQQLAPMG